MDMFGSVLTVVDVDSGALGSSSGCFAAVRTISYNIPFSLLLTFNISGESCFSAGRGVVWCRGSQRCQRNTIFREDTYKCLYTLLLVYSEGRRWHFKYYENYREISLTL